MGRHEEMRAFKVSKNFMKIVNHALHCLIVTAVHARWLRQLLHFTVRCPACGNERGGFDNTIRKFSTKLKI